MSMKGAVECIIAILCNTKYTNIGRYYIFCPFWFLKLWCVLIINISVNINLCAFRLIRCNIWSNWISQGMCCTMHDPVTQFFVFYKSIVMLLSGVVLRHDINPFNVIAPTGVLSVIYCTLVHNSHRRTRMAMAWAYNHTHSGMPYVGCNF